MMEKREPIVFCHRFDRDDYIEDILQRVAKKEFVKDHDMILLYKVVNTEYFDMRR